MKVLMLLAHPDDEIIFGYPILQDPNIEKEILCVADDRNNTVRQEWCGRRDALKEVGAMLDIEVSTMGYNSCFASELRHRALANGMDDSGPVFHARLAQEVANRECDFIFTHNPDGEYGHIDHLFMFHAALHLPKPLLITDMFIDANWMPKDAVGQRHQIGTLLQGSSGEALQHVDKELYGRCEAIYRKHKCWTWSKPPIETCHLLEVPLCQK